MAKPAKEDEVQKEVNRSRGKGGDAMEGSSHSHLKKKKGTKAGLKGEKIRTPTTLLVN